MVFLISFIPSFYYSFKPTKTVATSRAEGKVGGPVYQPNYNSQLPKENRLLINSIGLDTPIHEALSGDHEEALRQGVWRVPEFGSPANREKSLILTAHRFGYLKWSNSYRRQNSFYNLAKLKKGCIVGGESAAGTYIYEIYGLDEAEEVLDYSADLILYTCKFLDSSVRIFRYGRLLEV